jgi:hypothetical protein
MKLRTLCLAIAALLSSMVAIPTMAADASPAQAATPASGTHETRSAERKKVRAANKAANTKATKEGGEASAEATPPAKTGTHETRSAERKKNRAATAEAVKKGDIPKTTEAGETKK